jgi:hypothetical protein
MANGVIDVDEEEIPRSDLSSAKRLDASRAGANLFFFDVSDAHFEPSLSSQPRHLAHDIVVFWQSKP